MWVGKKDKGSYHLIRWDRIMRPKDSGGWGLKNIFNFGTTLAAKNMWRCFFVMAFSSEVSKDKYI